MLYTLVFSFSFIPVPQASGVLANLARKRQQEDPQQVSYPPTSDWNNMTSRFGQFNDVGINGSGVGVADGNEQILYQNSTEPRNQVGQREMSRPSNDMTSPGAMPSSRGMYMNNYPPEQSGRMFGQTGAPNEMSLPAHLQSSNQNRISNYPPPPSQGEYPYQ